MRLSLLGLLLAALLLSPCIVRADGTSVSVGDVEFNTFIPGASGAPGVTDFTVNNFTGPNSSAPDLPVSDSLVFNNATLTLTYADNSTQTFQLGDLATGSNIVLQLSDSTGILQALFGASLNQTSFTLSDGSTFVADSSSIGTTILPSAGSTLTADTDFGLINVSGSAATQVPEPSSILLVFSGLSSLYYACRKSRRPGPRKSV